MGAPCKNKIFDDQDAVYYYDYDNFMKIPNSKLIDFVTIRGNVEKDCLETWERHLQSVKTPYAIALYIDRQADRSIKRRVLWKEQRV